MVLKSFAKINLTLSVNKKLSSGLHDIQSLYCLVNIYDEITIQKIRNKNSDKITFKGPFSKFVDQSNNSIQKILIAMRKYKIISSYYSVKIYKKIPVLAGLAGGTSNAATVLKYLCKGKINENKFNKIIKYVGSDLRLFQYNQGYLKNLNTVIKLNKKYQLNFLIAFPNIKCSTKSIFSKVKNFTKKNQLNKRNYATKKKLLEFLFRSNNDLQSIVTKKYPMINKLILKIKNSKGCNFSRMTGSGSACYGMFINRNSSKAALKKLRKEYPKFWFSIAKTI